MNEGEIILGTRVNNKGLKNDLKETERIVNDFDKNNKVETTAELNIDYDEQEIRDKISELYQKMEKIIQEKTTVDLKIDGRNIKATGVMEPAEEERARKVAEESQEYQKLNQQVQQYESILQQITELKDEELFKNQEAFIEKSRERGLLQEESSLQQEINQNANLGPIYINGNRYVQKNNDLLEEQKHLLEENSGKINEMGASFNNVGNKINGLVKKVLRWGLALLGVRSIYTLITSSMSTLSQYSDTLSTKLQNIRLVLAVALEPVVERLVHWLEILLSYLNYITKTFFGIDIFARASELSTKKMADNVGSSAKSAKELRKQLAGFDEMNVLNDNTDTSGGGGAGSNADKYKFDLEEQPVAERFKNVVDWIKENYKWLLLIAGVIATIWALIKGMTILASLMKLSSALSGLNVPLLILLGAILKIATAVAGFGLYLKGLQIASDNTNSSFGDLLKSILLISLGIGTVTLALDPFIGIIMSLVGGIYILNQYMNNSEATVTNLDTAERNLMKAEKDRKKAVDDLKEAHNKYNNTMDSYINAVDKAKQTEEELDKVQKDTGLSGQDLYNQVENGTLTYKNMDDTQKSVYKAYRNNVIAQEDLKNKEDELTKATNEQSDAEKKAEESTKKLEKRKRELSLATQLASGDYDGFKKSIVDAMKNGEISAEEAQDYISQAMAGMSDSGRKTFKKDLPDSIKEGLDPSKYETKGQKLQRWFSNLSDKMSSFFKKLGGDIGESFWGAFKGTINWALKTIESILNKAVDFINKAIPYINKLPGVSIGKLSRFNLPRLASGAIINQPGRGVPIGGAIAGEAGREGILPLTDQRAMEMLGKEIGKWITINANIPVSVGNRQIGRVVKEIMANDDFAMNN